MEEDCEPERSRRLILGLLVISTRPSAPGDPVGLAVELAVDARRVEPFVGWEKVSPGSSMKSPSSFG